MNYENPELRDRLAAEYVLGTMPRLARRRFERLIAEDPMLDRVVAEWVERLAPIDQAMAEVTPPARVWQAIERHLLIGREAAAEAKGWFASLVLWRGATIAAGIAVAALFFYIAALPAPQAPTVVAVLSDDSGEPRWIALGGPRRAEISIDAIRPFPDDPAHSFELWGIANGPARPLGLLQRRPGQRLILEAALLPPPGGVLAVSVEPPNGSPSGLPTGPVLYKGKILNPAP